MIAVPSLCHCHCHLTLLQHSNGLQVIFVLRLVHLIILLCLVTHFLLRLFYSVSFLLVPFQSKMCILIHRTKKFNLCLHFFLLHKVGSVYYPPLHPLSLVVPLCLLLLIVFNVAAPWSFVLYA
jgi:hypothetical protein